MPLTGSKDTKGGERHRRILSAALEVFSKSSFAAATTEEIARLARVSKRDLYAEFPDKHAILAKVIETVLENGETNLRRVIADSLQEPRSTRVTLEIIGLALISEILSPLEGFVCRLAFAESARQPSIGKDYFERWYSRRNRIVVQFLSPRFGKRDSQTRVPFDKNQASRHFMALITHLPQLTASLGMTGRWTPKSIQAHVETSVECFLKAYPSLM
jgi:TetR/AcrR family transcriptional regulator, mexJK operon transcriptional repressor